MEYLHQELELQAGDIVEVTLEGNAANVMLLDPGQFEAYQNCRLFRYYEGYAPKSPARIEVPQTGHWHLVIDLGGGPGKVQASVVVHPVAEAVGSAGGQEEK